MTLESIITKLFSIFSTIGIILVGLAVFGYFSFVNVVIVLIMAFVALGVWIGFDCMKHKKFSIPKQEIFFLFLFLCISVFTSLMHHDLYRSRDNIGYVSAAIKIVESHSLAFDDIYTHPFHPFRNLGGHTFTSQFLPGQNIYLAVFHMFFGLQGMLASAGLVIFFTLITFYFIAKEITGSKSAGFSFVLIFVTSFLFFWTPRTTLSENIFMFLFWNAVLFLLFAHRTKKTYYFFLGLIPLFFALLVRVEAIPVIVMYCIASLMLFFHERKLFDFRSRYAVWLLIPISALFFFFEYFRTFSDEYFADSYGHIGALFTSSPVLFVCMFVVIILSLLFYKFVLRRDFVKQYAQHVVKYFPYVIKFLTVIIVLALTLYYFFVIKDAEFITWSNLKSFFVFRMLGKYYVLPFAFIAYFGYLKGYFNKKVFFILLIVLPFFVFFLDPLIALDQPWFMRRYYPVIIPFIYLLATVSIHTFLQSYKKIFTAVIFVIVSVHVSLFYPLIFYKEHNGVSKDLEVFSKQYSSQDVFFMYPGWDWQQWAYSLHYVYGMNMLPNFDNLTETDLRSIIDSYQNIYVISKNEAGFAFPAIPSDNLQLVSTFTFSYDELGRTTKLNNYLDSNDYLDVQFVLSQQDDAPPLDIHHIDQIWTIYKVKDKHALDIPVLANL